MKALLACLCLALLPLAAGAQSAFPGPSTLSDGTAQDLMIIQLGAWAAACEDLKADCDKIPPPRVGYGLLPAAFGVYTRGSGIVMVDLRIMGQPISLVTMFHEMVHYIRDVQDPPKPGPIPKSRVCSEEKEAHDRALAFAGRIGVTDPRTNSWTKIKSAYGCEE